MNSSKVRNHVTLMVFKDNLAARTFEVPLKWISRVGLILLFLVLLAVGCSILAGRFYWLNLQTDPSHVQDLEQEISNLRATLREVEKKPAAQILSANSAGVQPVLLETSVSNSNSTSAAVATPSSHSVQNTAAPLAVPATPLNFLGFATTVGLCVPEPSTLPFTVQALKASWRGSTLKVRFNLQYVKEEGNQQGRIVVLARGPETLMAYPQGVLNSTGTDFLISPEKGEFFSVSRFREVKADFGPIASKLNDVEVFLFDKENRVIFYQKLAPEPRKAAATLSRTPTDSGTVNQSETETATETGTAGGAP